MAALEHQLEAAKANEVEMEHVAQALVSEQEALRREVAQAEADLTAWKCKLRPQRRTQWGWSTWRSRSCQARIGAGTG